MANATESSGASVDIISYNLSYADRVNIAYAVDVNGAEESEVEMLFWYKLPSSVTDTPDYKDTTYSGIQKVRDGSVTTYTTVSYSKNGYKTTYSDSFVVSYDKSTGAIVAYDVDRENGESEYKIYATATKDGDSVTITLDKITENNYKEYEIGASITFTAGVEVPVINGENNVADMDDFEDFMDIAENFGESAFEDLFERIF